MRFATSPGGPGPGSTTTKLIVTNAGNVGIGTATPTAKMAVAGTIKSTTHAQNVQTTKTNLATYHPDCNSLNTFGRGGDFLVCNSACSRHCRQALGYSGGTLVEWQTGTDVAFCDCIP